MPNSNKCLILNYHSVIDGSNREEEDPIYSISKECFIEHLKIIKKSGKKIVTIPELYVNNSSSTIAITFDDGHRSDYEIVFPILQKYNIKASFFISPNNVPLHSNRWAQYQEMSDLGNHIGAHGLTHKYLSDLSIKSQKKEIEKSTNTIADKLKITQYVLALPGGKYNNETIRISKALGLKGLLTTNFGLVDTTKMPYLLNRCTVTKKLKNNSFQKLIAFDTIFIKKHSRISRIKKICQKLLGTKVSDTLNYYFRG